MELSDCKNLEKISNPYIVKCILLGDRGTGKSTLANLLSYGYCEPQLSTTIGIDFLTKTINLKEYNNHKVKLHIWDTAGHERFKSITRSYLRDAYIAFLVFDITDRHSWANLNEWKKDLDINNKYNFLPRIVLVGTKSDLKNHVITTDEIIKRAEEWNCESYVISSKRNKPHIVINRMFSIVIENLHKEIVTKCIHGEELPDDIYKKDNINLYDNNNNNKCCIIS